MKLAVLVVGLSAVLLSTSSNAEDATTSSCTLLPAMISGAIPDLFSAIETCSKERQGSAALYEISGTHHGSERRAFFDASGALVGLDETLHLHSLPAFILDVLADRYAGQAIWGIQKMRRATSVFYEITIEKDGKQQDIFFNTSAMRGA